MDGAFLGSFTYALAHAKLGLEVIARPELVDGTSTYHGLIFVRKDSGIKTIKDMKGKDSPLLIRQQQQVISFHWHTLKSTEFKITKNILKRLTLQEPTRMQFMTSLIKRQISGLQKIPYMKGSRMMMLE